MKITIEIPDDVAEQLREKMTDLERATLEALAVEAYRAVLLSAGQVAELLGLNIWTVQGFLAEHGAYLHYDKKDLEEDSAVARRAFDKKRGLLNE
jgi:predicted HTH domain antitoxin